MFKNDFRYAFNGNYFQDTIKGLICTKTNISHVILDDRPKIDFSNKQILMQTGFASICLGFSYFFFFSALKKRRFYFIRKLQINLIDLRAQFIFFNLILMRAFLDQALNIFFLIYYKELGKDDIFKLWWFSFYLENLGRKK